MTKQSHKKIVLFLMLACLCLCGCSILGNLDEIFTLQDYSNEKDAQHRLVKSINAHYDELLKAIAQGQMDQYKDEAAFIHAFGEPILKKDLSFRGERWLYRYAINSFAKDKVYVYFARDGKVIRWEKLPCPKFF